MVFHPLNDPLTTQKTTTDKPNQSHLGPQFTDGALISRFEEVLEGPCSVLTGGSKNFEQNMAADN